MNSSDLSVPSSDKSADVILPLKAIFLPLAYAEPNVVDCFILAYAPHNPLAVANGITWS